MAKRFFRMKNVDEVTKKMEKIFEDAATNDKVLNEIGQLISERIVFLARTGKSSEGDTNPTPFPDLKDSTVRQRRAFQKNYPGEVDAKFFKPGRANVTMTGQLLESFTYKIKNNSVVLFFKDSRKKVRKGDESSNNAVYSNLVKLGFGFVGLDERGQKRVKKIVLDEFRRTIKKIF